MAEKVKLSQTVVKQSEFKEVFDTSFSYFIPPAPTVPTDTVEELFRLYDKLYLNIPATGPNSHQYLIERSTFLYNPAVAEDNQLQPLRAEIAELRTRLLQANEEISVLSSQLITLTSGIGNG
jgi:hypothetical protein